MGRQCIMPDQRDSNNDGAAIIGISFPQQQNHSAYGHLKCIYERERERERERKTFAMQDWNGANFSIEEESGRQETRAVSIMHQESLCKVAPRWRNTTAHTSI